MIENVSRGKPWFATKVLLLMWPGKTSDFENTRFTDFKIHALSTHLEAGIFIDMHKVGWSYWPLVKSTQMFDLTKPGLL